MRPFDELVAGAAVADMTGWSFTFLDGRATEERPPWGYARMLVQRLGRSEAALDIDTGGGEIINSAPELPADMAVTESWPPNARRARALLAPRGVQVVETIADEPLPFPDRAFDLVTARHPVQRPWSEIHRVLRPGGHYFAQHVGPASPTELIEFFRGPGAGDREDRDPGHEVAAAESAGLMVDDLQRARCRMAFYDVGAVVWILRKCVWWVPDFTVTGYLGQLRRLDAAMRGGEPFVAHSTRHLIDAHRPWP